MKETTDIWFASYLVSLGHEIKDFEVLGRHKGRYKFDLPDEDWKKLKLSYIQSEAKKIEELHKQLKDLLY